MGDLDDAVASQARMDAAELKRRAKLDQELRRMADPTRNRAVIDDFLQRMAHRSNPGSELLQIYERKDTRFRQGCYRTGKTTTGWVVRQLHTVFIPPHWGEPVNNESFAASVDIHGHIFRWHMRLKGKTRILEPPLTLDRLNTESLARSLAHLLVHHDVD